MDWALTPPKAALFLLDSSGYWNVLKVKLKSAFLKMPSLDLTSLLQHPHKSISFKYLKKVFSSILVFSVIHSKTLIELLLYVREREGLEMAPCRQAAGRLRWENETYELDHSLII